MSAFPILHARDVERSLGFYRDELGFALLYRWPEAGDADYLYLEREGSGLGLGRADSTAHGIPVRAGPPATVTICVYVADLDELYAKLVGHRVPGRAAPADKPWGERIAFVEDPDGYPVLLIQQPAGSRSKS